MPNPKGVNQYTKQGSAKMQTLEVTHTSGAIRTIQVHPSRAFEALNKYKKMFGVKSVKIK